MRGKKPLLAGSDSATDVKCGKRDPSSFKHCTKTECTPNELPRRTRHADYGQLGLVVQVNNCMVRSNDLPRNPAPSQLQDLHNLFVCVLKVAALACWWSGSLWHHWERGIHKQCILNVNSDYLVLKRTIHLVHFRKTNCLWKPTFALAVHLIHIFGKTREKATLCHRIKYQTTNVH